MTFRERVPPPGEAPSADFAWLVIALDRPRVERRAPSYGPCISEDRKTVTCNSRFSQETRRLAAHDGLGDRVWLVVDDVHELARRSQTSRSKKLRARIVAYRSYAVTSGPPITAQDTPWSGRNTFGQGVTHVRIGRGLACQIIPSLIAPRYAAPSACRPRSYQVTTWPRHWPTDSAKSPPACHPHAAGAPTPASSNARCPISASNATNNATGPSPPATRRHSDRRPHWRTVPINPPTKTRPSRP
jgi:hypothetical protein